MTINSSSPYFILAEQQTPFSVANNGIKLIKQTIIKPPPQRSSVYDSLANLQQRIKNLDTTVKELNKILEQHLSIEDLTNQLNKWKGENKAQIRVVGSLIKLFCSLWNHKSIQNGEKLLQGLTQCKELVTEKSHLLKSLNLQFENLSQSNPYQSMILTSNPIEALREEIESLSKQETFSINDLDFIFRIENAFRDVLKDSYQQVAFKEEYQVLYQQVESLVSKAKDCIRKHPSHLSVCAAANKGAAAVKGFQALKSLSEGKSLPPTEQSINQVRIFKEEEAVLKKAKKRSAEEEARINDLFDLMLEGGTVGSFNIKDPSEAVKQLSLNTIEASKKNSSLDSLVDIQSKPYISDMLLMGEHQAIMPILLQRLTPKAEQQAILTGIFQLLDLHALNLGLVPEITPEYEAFKGKTFTVASPYYANLSLKELIVKYLSGEITSNTYLTYCSNNQKINLPLKQMPDLQKVLNGRWEFAIFDADISLAESNFLQVQVRKRQMSHLIPLRSALLQFDWKDQPLSEQATQELTQRIHRTLSANNNQASQMKQWITRQDAPIRKRLSRAAQEKIDQEIQDLLINYTLSAQRYKGQEATIEALQKQFAEDLAKNKLTKIWSIIESELSVVKIHKNDTWESIANRHYQKISTLQKLNPNIKLIPGQKIKIEYNLTGNSLLAEKARRKIAAQFFPRLTLHQEGFLFERLKNCKKYLKEYQALKDTDSNDDQLATKIEKFLKHPSSPLSDARRSALLQELKGLLGFPTFNPGALASFKDQVCQECQPTYYNFMKAMYPFLGDAYELSMALYDKKRAGLGIGHYQIPLDTIIQEALGRFDSQSIPFQTALYLKKQIDNPSVIKSFFGIWN